MKTITLGILALIVLSYSSAMAQTREFEQGNIPTVEKLDRVPNLFKSESLFYGGQPSLETLQWLNSEGVNLVINLRSENENESFAESAYKEEEQVTKLGMRYVSIPVDGYNSYTPKNVEKLAEALKGDYNKVLIHCASCGRVSYFMVAYLVNEKGYSLANAIAFGKQLKFKSPLEFLLKDEIKWETKATHPSP